MSRYGKDADPVRLRVTGELRYQIRRFLHFSEQVAREKGLEPHEEAVAVFASTGDHEADVLGQAMVYQTMDCEVPVLPARDDCPRISGTKRPDAEAKLAGIVTRGDVLRALRKILPAQ